MVDRAAFALESAARQGDEVRVVVDDEDVHRSMT
jgi:hypothetical protein